jgi:hypothetical protein
MALSETFPSTRTANKTGVSCFVPRAPSRVPITARELVDWTYAVQRAQGVPELSLEPQGRSQTGAVVDGLLDFAALGCKVDISSNAAARWGETRCHEDAITVHSLVQHLSPRQRFLLIEHGKARCIPEWEPKIFPLRCVPVQGSAGKPRGLYLGSGRLHVGSEITYEGDWPSRDVADAHRAAADAHKRQWADESNWPPAVRRRRSERPMSVEHDWSPEPWRRCEDEVLQRAREEYRAWYEALWALCDGLEASGPRGLQRYRITALGAACEPWNK